MNDAVLAMHRALSNEARGAPAVLVGESWAIAVAGRTDSAALGRRSDKAAAIYGHFYWNDSELAGIAEQDGHAQALLRGYEKHGERLAVAVSGTFSMILIDESDGSLLLAIDRTGTRPLTWTKSGDAVVFGSSSAALRAHPAVSSRVDSQALFDFLYFHYVPSPGSVFAGIRRLLPGEYCVHREGRHYTECYWQVAYDDQYADRSHADLAGEVSALVRASVAREVGSGTVGAFLSGGIDSSTITGVLGEVLNEAPRAYSIGFGVNSYNEMEYARLAAKHFAARHREYFVTPEDIVAAVPTIAAGYAEPFGNSSVVPAYFCALLACEDGITRILGGDGGDELFGGNSRYAKQKLFAVYDKVPALVRKRLFEPLFLSSRVGDSIAPIRKVRRYVEQATVPMPERLETYNLLHYFGVETVIHSDLLDQVVTERPLQLLRSSYDAVRGETIINKMLGLDLQYTLADNDLVKVNGACGIAGLDVAYPLLSDELVEFAAHLPPRLKVKGQELRYFFKSAYRDFLPDEILRKSKHGFGLPFGEWAVTNDKLKHFVRENLESLKARRVVRAEFIDDLLDSKLEEHPHFFGDMAWILMMLEQWYQKHQD